MKMFRGDLCRTTGLVPGRNNSSMESVDILPGKFLVVLEVGPVMYDGIGWYTVLLDGVSLRILVTPSTCIEVIE